MTAGIVGMLMLGSFVGGYAYNQVGIRQHLTVPGLRKVASLPGAEVGAGDVTYQLQPLTLIWEVMGNLKAHYVEPLTDDRALAYGAVRGMLRAVKDPYTRFMDPDEYKQFTAETTGSIGGIGAMLTQARPRGRQVPRPEIARVFARGPADQAGLKEGDLVYAVDGQSTKDLALDEVVAKIRGEPGTKVRLTLYREREDKYLELTITRGRVETPTVSTYIYEGKYGYIHLLAFNEESESKLKIALDEMAAANVEGLILDLRSNPGGLLSSAVDVTSIFVPKGKPVVRVVERGNPEVVENATGQDYRALKVPLVVVVDFMTASAAEILAGALKDHQVAQHLVGVATFGKGMVQTVYRLQDGSGVAITTAKYLTPSGFDLNGKGLPPDVVVTFKAPEGTNAEPTLMADKDRPQLDNQFQAALKLLKGENVPSEPTIPSGG